MKRCIFGHAGSAVNLKIYFREMKDCSFIMKNSSKFFIGPAFSYCFHEAAVHIHKLIILIGPPVFCMEMYGDVFAATTILQTHMMLLLDGSFVL